MSMRLDLRAVPRSHSDDSMTTAKSSRISYRMLAGAARQRDTSGGAQECRMKQSKYSEHFYATVASRHSCRCSKSGSLPHARTRGTRGIPSATMSRRQSAKNSVWRVDRPSGGDAYLYITTGCHEACATQHQPRRRHRYYREQKLARTTRSDSTGHIASS